MRAAQRSMVTPNWRSLTVGVLSSSRHPTDGLAGEGVALRAGELAFQVGERGDDLRSLVDPVPSADGDLVEDACINELCDGVIGGREGSANERCAAVHRDHGCARECGQQQVRRGVSANRGNPLTPGTLDVTGSTLEGVRVGDRSDAGSGETADPLVRSSESVFARCWASVAAGVERLDVGLRPGCQDERDGWEDPEREATASEDEVDERPAGSPVAVHEGWMVSN